MPTTLQPSTGLPIDGHSSYSVRSMVVTGLAAVALGAAAVATPFVASAVSPAPVSAPALMADSTPGALAQSLDRSSVRADVVNDLTDAVQNTAENQGGTANRGFQMLENFRPGIVHVFLNEQLDQYANALQPYYDAYKTSGSQGGFGSYLQSRSQEVSDALLTVSDRFADNGGSSTARMIYRVARPDAQADVTAALPQIGSIMEKYSN